MARSQYIYVVMHRRRIGDDAKPVAAFTVKHEMKSAWPKIVRKHIGAIWVLRIRDNQPDIVGEVLDVECNDG